MAAENKKKQGKVIKPDCSQKFEMTAENKERIVDVTFNSTPESVNGVWGWRINGNPERQPGGFTETEWEIMEMAENKTPQSPEVFSVKTYSYFAPFNYPNFKVEFGRPGTGIEINPDGAEIDIYPYGAIILEHEHPITAVTVIGSGCSGSGYVIIEAEPLVWKYPRTAVRMMKKDLWGIHVRGDAFLDGNISENWNDAGLSSARFDLPESRKIIIGGGSHGADPHYCFRIIRLEVKEPAPAK